MTQLVADTATRIAPAVSGPQALTSREKAAVVVRFLLAEGVDLSLDKLDAHSQAQLMQQMAQMSHVDRSTVAAVVEEFLNALDRIGVSFQGGIMGALEVLGGKIDPALAEQMKRDASGGDTADPWERLTTLDPEVLLPLVECESIEVAAVILSKLSVARAAELLGKMAGSRARKITFAMSLTKTVSPQSVAIIGQALIDQIDNTPETAFDDDPIERMGAILNFSQARTRDDVLVGLDEEDKDLAEQVRKSIFTFENIPARLTDRDVPKVTKDVAADVLAVALQAAMQSNMEGPANFILDNMSKRLSQGIRDEMAELGNIKEDAGEAAMGEVVAAIRALESTGEIVLRVEQDTPN
ncbi:FliG C-terminal domain-containing protein [Nereida sp. MMG025]|uniref:FliG C-terminal domain-containing protein n=1 Tax=Nereida sp. MMG025 TaxID=2909981 RepID=UPI001F2F189D|nr:FliG C-terminal domain-containing protein [Nereida sp. MMG025]MCF6443394.1 flagellar motor switch protein FliG [Nereida sp. MMG025]